MATPAREARESAGLTIDEAAKRAHITRRYLQHTEQHGAPYVLAVKLARLYNCSLMAFLKQKGGNAPGAQSTVLGTLHTSPAHPVNTGHSLDLIDEREGASL